MNTPIKKTAQEIATQLRDPKVFEEEQKKKEELSKKAASKKEELKKQAKPKIQQYYDVKVECMLPATLTFRVLAEDAVQALELTRGKSPNSVQHKLAGRKDLVAKVYDAGSMMMRHMKRLLG